MNHLPKQIMDSRLDVAPFCEHIYFWENENSLEFTWADARNIVEIHIQLLSLNTSETDSNSYIKTITYWQNNWPKHRRDPAQKQGSGHSGWARQDDLFNGVWQKADFFLEMIDTNILKINFNLLTDHEFPEENFPVNFRRTLKLKIQFDRLLVNVNEIQAVQIFTPSELNKYGFKILPDPMKILPSDFHFSVEIFNGFIDQIGKTQDMETTLLQDHCSSDTPIRILMTKPTDDSSFDDTLITITPQIMDVDIFPFFGDSLLK